MADLDADTSKLIGKFLQWAGSFLAQTMTGLSAALKAAETDGDIFEPDTHTLQKTPEHSATSAMLQNLQEMSVLTFSTPQAAHVLQSVEFVSYFIGAPLKFLVEGSEAAGVQDVAILESLAHMVSRVRGLPDHVKKVIAIPEHQVEQWVSLGAAASERNLGSILKPKLAVVENVIFADTSYWQPSADNPETMAKLHFLDKGDASGMAENCSARAQDMTMTEAELAHIENICLALDCVRLAVYLKAAWVVTRCRWQCGAVGVWMTTVNGS